MLALEYSHSPLPAASGASVEAAQCVDQSGVVANDGSGRGYSCKDIGAHCEQNPQLKAKCPLTCGLCSANTVDWSKPENAAAMKWQPLEFKNLPGSLTKRPEFGSPYHRRLDWQVWIEVTASMEHRYERFRSDPERRLLSLPLPNILKSLTSKLFLGDTDAANLLGSPGVDVLLSSNVTAVRYTFYNYKFAPLAELMTPAWPWAERNWWTREQISTVSYLEAGRSEGATDREHEFVRRSPSLRHWLLALSVGGAVAATTILRRSMLGGAGHDTRSLSALKGLLLLAGCTALFAVALYGDYQAQPAAWYRLVGLVTRADKAEL